ncbi:zf-C2HC5 domain-containing protein [Phanerochaete sordida]|uniref:Zf-C2HC5 domain-containing protein n=1 Tax=Phanerochaete sordida TaxID=48140 RepID=A0A9P3G8Y8_9APHY|nr:zf-C2HC5 domain-containing protein [Phanerochaete sordida]
MSYKTAWSKGGGSMPSDRIPSRTTTPKPKPAKGNRSAGTSTPGTPSAPKSKEVLRLETLRDGMQALVSSGGVPQKDPRGGCFCQARSHVISPYNPACMQCGLPLCQLNLPHYACPSCNAPLHIPSAQHALLARILDELDSTLEREDAARRRVEDERKRVEGSFPMLAGAGPAPSVLLLPQHQPQQQQQPQAHKVLSLNAKTKRVTVASYTKRPKATPPSSGPATRAGSPTEWDDGLPPRVPAPPREVPVPQVATQRFKDRPWFNAREEIAYVDPARL